MDGGHITIVGLCLIMALVLLLPFSIKRVEEELELFLLLMGAGAVTVARQWSLILAGHAATEPLMIAGAVFAAGLLFRLLRGKIETSLKTLTAKAGLPWTVFIITAALGLASSIITAIIAALVLCEIITALKLDRKTELRLTVYACYAIGLGAALTPLGEPLSTIVVAKLKEPPHNAGFGYLLNLVGLWVVPGVLLVSAMAAWQARCAETGGPGLRQDSQETLGAVALRAFKVYIFVGALVLLGAGLKPLAERTVAQLPSWQLYWLNIVSAALDNATLAAAEIVPSMSAEKITAILMGLLVAGGMLIPGNIPNIISAAKLNIKSREWAAFAAPIGLVLMLAYFLVLLVSGHLHA